jgi:tRNA A-37 threonylcarbamoyl transferase component Bud32
MKLCTQCETGYPDQTITCPTHGSVLGEIRELKPGMLVHGTYRIVRKLGQGGMGSVYLADHLLMGEKRALKFLSAELSQNEAFTNRFRREARTLRMVWHRNVVESGDLEPAEDGSLFFAMEYVAGPDLRRFLEIAPRPFDVPLALAITRGIAEGLRTAHSLGIVHRDIKPANILMASVGDAWVPKIADFGIVATKENSSSHTRTGTSLLTMAYAAPEQWRGVRAAELDGRTDLYALGGVLYEILTGQTAFDAENYEGWAYQHQRVAPKAPSRLRPELAEWRGLDALVLKLLAKDPKDRPRDVAELIELIGRIRRVPVTQRVMTPLAWKGQAKTISAKAFSVFQRNPRWVRTGAAALMLVLAFVLGHAAGAGRQHTDREIFSKMVGEPIVDAADLTGTTWSGTDTALGSFKYEFLAGGILRSTYGSRTYTDGQWKQIGDVVYIQRNKRYCHFMGRISGSSITGNAWNIENTAWTWTVQKM